MRKKSRPMEPFASYSEEGDLVWNVSLVKRVKELGKLSRGSGTGGSGTGGLPDHNLVRSGNLSAV